MSDKYLQEVLEKYTKLRDAASAVREAQQLLEYNRVTDNQYFLFRLDRKYAKGYRTAWKCLEELLPLSPNDNPEKSDA